MPNLKPPSPDPACIAYFESDKARLEYTRIVMKPRVIGAWAALVASVATLLVAGLFKLGVF